MTVRSTLAIAGFTALLVPLASQGASAQRQQVPGPDTRRVLVTTFRGDVVAGVTTANEIRDRIASEFSIKQLMPRSKKDIDNALRQSGYATDSALSPTDVQALARSLSIDEVLDGTVQKTTTGFRVAVRMFMPRDVALSQPLLVVESNNLGDVAKQVVSEYERARKQLPATQECENGIRSNNQAAAIAGARKGIAIYPKATLSRLCLAQAFQLSKASGDSLGSWKDSVVAVTNDVINLDWSSKIAHALKYDAYKAKGDSAKALGALEDMVKADPTNVTMRQQYIAEVITQGKPLLALPYAKALVEEFPGDPQPLRTYWLVLRQAKMFKESVKVGTEYAASDTAAADPNYFFRQMDDLAADSNFTKAAELAAAGSVKFPGNVQLLFQKAQLERRAGQPAIAKASIEAALKLDAKLPDANLLLAQIANDLGDYVAAIAAAKADVAADPTKNVRDAQFVFGMGQLAYKAFTTTKKPEDYKKTMELLAASDEMNPTANAKFFMAVSAFGMLQSVMETLPASRVCSDFKAANDLVTTVSLHIPRGASVNVDVARQIMAALPTYQPFIDGSVTRFCR